MICARVSLLALEESRGCASLGNWGLGLVCTQCLLSLGERNEWLLSAASCHSQPLTTVQLDPGFRSGSQETQALYFCPGLGTHPRDGTLESNCSH